MQTGKSIEISWVNQPGRLISKMESYADGFRGSITIAGVTVVAENKSQHSGFAENAVAVIRDAFAEGVAYGVVDVLKDVIDEINALDSRNDQFPCSFAAAAVLEDEVWVYSAGTCRAFMSDVDSTGRGLKGVVDLSSQGIKYFRLKPGQSIIIVTHGLRKLMGSEAALSYSLRCRKPLSFCLSEIVRETRIKFRKKGGSAAAVRLCAGSTRKYPARKKLIIYILASVVAVISAFLILCRSREATISDMQEDSVFTVETVMPLE